MDGPSAYLPLQRTVRLFIKGCELFRVRWIFSCTMLHIVITTLEMFTFMKKYKALDLDFNISVAFLFLVTPQCDLKF